MTALSIVVPDALAQDSSWIAKKMHISRSQFIRLAIENEIKAYRLRIEQQDMVAGFKALKQQASYLDEMHDLEQLDVNLKDEGEILVERIALLTQGGVYLARLDPSKHAELGKIRPVVVLMGQFVLDVQPTSVLVCPLSSQSYPGCSQLHVALPPRDNLQKNSYALVEHCRSISVKRLIEPRIAQLTMKELGLIFIRLRHMCNMDHMDFVIQT